MHEFNLVKESTISDRRVTLQALMKYSSTFFQEIEEGSEKSADVIASLLVDTMQPASVIDIGCGTGVWLKAFRKFGVSDFLGIDGPYVTKDMLLIPEENFLAWNLSESLNINRKFDLALCLEVAEHLPAEKSDQLVELLTSCSDVVVFSAAIPFQGGTNHVNEQWQSYWIAKFSKYGYTPMDLIRPVIWNDQNVRYWYKQNLFVYVKIGAQMEKDFQKTESSGKFFVDVVHPDRYLAAISYSQRNEERYRIIKESRAYRIANFLNKLLAHVRRR